LVADGVDAASAKRAIVTVDTKGLVSTPIAINSTTTNASSPSRLPN
jgi:hypothetical protein